MLDHAALNGHPAVLFDAFDACDVVRIDLRDAKVDLDTVQVVLDRIAASGTDATRVARIAALVTAHSAALHLADSADALEIAFPAGAPAVVAEALQTRDVAELRARRRASRGDAVTAVIDVSRTMIGHLAALVETALAAEFDRVVFTAGVIHNADDMDGSIYFDRDAFNADLDRAIRSGKQRGIDVRGIKFATQGAATAGHVAGHRRTVVIDLGDAGRAVKNSGNLAAFSPPLPHMDLPATHFSADVMASEAFRSRALSHSDEQSVATGLASLFAIHHLDRRLYADVASRLGLDLSAALVTGTGASIQALNRAIEERFRAQREPGVEKLEFDLTKPFLGYNWGLAQSALLPNQYQFRRSFNESQTPVVLAKVKPGHSYALRTTIHDAEPGDGISFLLLTCNGFIPTDQAIQWEGRNCVHVCVVPARVVDAADGSLRVCYRIMRKSQNGMLGRVGLRSLAVEALAPASSSVRPAMLRSEIAGVADSAALDDPADGIGLPSRSAAVAFPSFPELSHAAALAVQREGVAILGQEEAIAAFGLQIAELCACGMLGEAARRTLAQARKIESNMVAWVVASPVEHRYTGTESALRLLALVSAILVRCRLTNQVGALFQKITDIAPDWRPAWLALAKRQIAAGAYDAAIHSARSAVHCDVCCIASQEVLRAAYLAKYPRTSEKVIDGVPLYDLTDRFCSIPFDRIETAKDGIVWTCCPAWLGAPVGNMHRTHWEDAWNSDQAAIVRQSILEGDFKYCNKGICPAILADSLPRKAEVTDPHFRHYIDNKIVKLPEGPREISLSHDPSCNLACPQCRNEFILADDAQNTEFDATIEPFIKPLIDYAQLDKSVVLMSGDGEIFISPHYHGVLKLFDPVKHAGITLNLLSNGLVFETGWIKVPNIHKLVNKITISTDAASEAAYKEIRGGSWVKLYRNLKFIAGLRRRGEIRQFDINYAVQSRNYKDMRRMVEIGLELGVDRIAFAILRNGGTYDAAEYAARAIFEQDHPNHQDFIDELRDPIFRNPIVEISQFAGFLSVHDPVHA